MRKNRSCTVCTAIHVAIAIGLLFLLLHGCGGGDAKDDGTVILAPIDRSVGPQVRP